jgi:hypothetical protein
MEMADDKDGAAGALQSGRNISAAAAGAETPAWQQRALRWCCHWPGRDDRRR